MIFLIITEYDEQHYHDPDLFYSDDSGIHLRESNIMETNIGIICSDHFVELDHEMLKWDMDGICEMCWYIVLMIFGYLEICSSERIFARHYTENFNVFQLWISQLRSKLTQLNYWSVREHLIKFLIDIIDLILYNRNFRYRVLHQYYWFG